MASNSNTGKQNNKPKQQNTAAAAKPVPGVFQIKYPILLLCAIVLAVYFFSFGLGYTDLDDTIFIRDLAQYNESLSNLVTSFHRGVFDAVNDTYYRPLFLDSMILNYHLSEMSIGGYHIINVLFHLISTCLLFTLFKKTGLKEVYAFILAMLFAVHPVLTQAVSWIPGRNDTMLAIFTLAFLIFSINYEKDGKIKWLLLSLFFLLCAFFTKETAVFDAPIAFIIIIYMMRKNWLDKRNIIQYAAWTGVFLVWYITRSMATIKTSGFGFAQVMHDFIGRSPVIIQYFGKIFLPFNLNVFPILEDTVYYYGIAAVVLFVAILVLAKNKSSRVIITGLSVFILFLLPVLLVPRALNEQLFEHRLYLPIIGILLILPETVLFRNKLTDKQLTMTFCGIVAILGVINISHQQDFKDPLTFWEHAAEASPHSAYAVMMYGARVKEHDKAAGYALIRRAYALNPNEKYLNYYYGLMLQEQDSIPASEKYLLKERNTSDYYECDFYLARVALTGNKLNEAISYLERYVKRDSMNEQANNNLLLLYINTNQVQKAHNEARFIQRAGLPVPGELVQKANSMN